ncbi:MAG: hypothetical protein NTU89_00280 [Candidatus Dependentiae bacterium]|nr:hypothetical protein [Candidatus Dependentiae bacterium]
MSTNQKYIFCVLSLLVSSQAVGMRQVTGKTGAQVGRALGAGAASTVRRQFETSMPDLMSGGPSSAAIILNRGQYWCW